MTPHSVFAAVLGFLLGSLIMYIAQNAQNIANLTRDEEQRAIQIILNEYGTDKSRAQELINELQGYVLNLKAKDHELSNELLSIVNRVRQTNK